MPDCIRFKQFNWHDHVRRMNEERLPRKTLEKCTPGRNSWMQEVTNGKSEKGINSMEWIDREEWKE